MSEAVLSPSLSCNEKRGKKAAKPQVYSPPKPWWFWMCSVAVNWSDHPPEHVSSALLHRFYMNKIGGSERIYFIAVMDFTWLQIGDRNIQLKHYRIHSMLWSGTEKKVRLSLRINPHWSFPLPHGSARFMQVLSKAEETVSESPWQQNAAKITTISEENNGPQRRLTAWLMLLQELVHYLMQG